MKKSFDTTAIVNDLEGSAFFPTKKPTPPSTDSNTSEEGVPPPVPLGVPRTVRGTVPLIPKVKRPIRQRQPFDIYEDQYQTLKGVAEAEKGFENGRGMSHMVREAIDNYIRDYIDPKK
jgi:hypothetical protein